MLLRSISIHTANILGLVLIVVGVTILVYVGYNVVELYQNPQSIKQFAYALQETMLGNKDNAQASGLDEALVYLSWPVVILLLLLQGKVAMSCKAE